MRHSEGSRDEFPDLLLGPRGAEHPAPGGEADRQGALEGIRSRTTGGDGASRSRSAGVGRGGAGRPGGLLAWFLRAWSGPQAVSSVRRAHGRRGPHQRRATFANRSVYGAELRNVVRV